MKLSSTDEFPWLLLRSIITRIDGCRQYWVGGRLKMPPRIGVDSVLGYATQLKQSLEEGVERLPPSSEIHDAIDKIDAAGTVSPDTRVMLDKLGTSLWNLGAKLKDESHAQHSCLGSRVIS